MNVQKIESIKACNKCGKEISAKYDALFGEGVIVRVDWGYFSAKDGQRHTFCLCEECYDKIVSEFEIPVTIEEKTELL